MKNSIHLFFLPLAGLLAMQTAWAEGSTIDDGVHFGEIAGAPAGNHGVNRVIRTNVGYSGVLGNVKLSFVMPKNENLGNNSYQDISNSPPTLDTVLVPLTVGVSGKPQGNKPSVYLGGTLDGVVLPAAIPAAPGFPATRRTHVDVGLQYEPITIFNVEPGWSIFFRLSDIYVTDSTGGRYKNLTTNPRVPDSANPAGKAWRSQGVGDNYTIEGPMIFEADPYGYASFTWGPLGTIYANLSEDKLGVAEQDRWRFVGGRTVAPWGDSTQLPPVIFDTTSYAEGDVKRVTALTRDAPYDSVLDGTFLAAEWSECKVKAVAQNKHQKWRIKAENVTTDLPLQISMKPSNFSTPVSLDLVRGDTAAQIRAKFIATGLITAATVSTGLPAANPLAAPTVAATGATATGATWLGTTGDYSVRYSFVNAQGQTELSPLVKLTLTHGMSTNVQVGVPGLPAGATSTNVYLETAVNSGILKSVGNTTANFLNVTDVPPMGAPVAPSTNTTATPVSATIDIDITTPTAGFLLVPRGPVPPSPGTLPSGYTLTETQEGGSTFNDWRAADVRQERTGYDAPRLGHVAFDRRYGGRRTSFSLPIVSYKSIGTAPNIVSSSTLRQEMGDASRYKEETVYFNLGTLARPVGGTLR